MNCKGNELAIIKTNPKLEGHEHYGKIVFITTFITSPSGNPAWNYEGNLYHRSGQRYPHIADAVLRPIGNPDEDAVDETLTWKCGKPPVVDVDAIKKAKQKEKIDA